MGHYSIENVHISLIRSGDTIIRDGKERTVCPGDIKHDTFFGHLLFGDCYKLGYEPVPRIKFKRVTNLTKSMV